MLALICPPIACSSLISAEVICTELLHLCFTAMLVHYAHPLTTCHVSEVTLNAATAVGLRQAMTPASNGLCLTKGLPGVVRRTDTCA